MNLEKDEVSIPDLSRVLTVRTAKEGTRLGVSASTDNQTNWVLSNPPMNRS